MATLEERLQNLTQDIRPTMGAGVMSDREMERLMNAMPDAVRANKSLLSGVPDPMMSGVDTSIMQPLVEMGF